YPTAVSGLSVPEISTIRAPQHQRIARQSFFHVLGEMPCRLMCAVFPPASSALSHSKLSIRTGSPRLDCISFVFALSIPRCASLVLPAKGRCLTKGVTEQDTRREAR